MYFSGMAVFVNHSQLCISMNVCSCFIPRIDRLGSKFPLFRGLNTNLISTFKRERREGDRGRMAVRTAQRIHPTHVPSPLGHSVCLSPHIVQDWFSEWNLSCLQMVTFYQPGEPSFLLGVAQYMPQLGTTLPDPTV